VNTRIWPTLSLTALCAFGAVVLWPGGGAGAQEAPGGGPAELLPDLDQVRPSGLQVQTVRTRRGTRFRLGFTSATDNGGTGPLLLEGRRRSGSLKMTVSQRVSLSDGTTGVRRDVGEFRYEPGGGHDHFHYQRFMRYELRRASDFKRVVTDRKSGFCLRDAYVTKRSDFPLPGHPRDAVFTSFCGKHTPSLRTMREGISVGWGDVYKAYLEGQHLELNGLPAGRYLLVHRVNVKRRLKESDYTNNAASVLIRLRWPNGSRRQPALDVLARCPDSERCPAESPPAAP
jgi:hypothetical protein